MFLRTVTAKTKNGPAEYLQLCHNRWDPQARRSKTEVLFSFGRKDKLEVTTVERLVATLARLLPPEQAQPLTAILEGDDTLAGAFEYLGSRSLGGSWFLDQLWQRMQIDRVLKRLLAKGSYRAPVERLLFAMVANRALAPASKLYLEHWISEEVYVPGLPEVDVQQLYRAMDFLLEASEEIQHDVFFSVANLLNLEVDLLFLDTTRTYFEVEGEDDFRRWGKESKDKRPDLPQVVVGFAVTRNGIPARCWVWPGNTSDQQVLKQVKEELGGWRLRRVVMVQDAGFNSAQNRRILQRAGGHYIIGEKPRVGKEGLPVEALRRPGKCARIAENLEAKEVIVGGDSEARRRYIIVRNPEEAKRDAAKRADIVRDLEEQLVQLRQLAGEPHRKAACELRSHPVYGRYIHQTQTGKLRLDKAKIRREAQMDGKFLISTSDDGLSVEDVVLGYKQLAVVERVFRDLKHGIDLRPIRHRLPERIRAHVLLCWLAMLLIRVAETETGETWFRIKKALNSLDLGIHRVERGEVYARSPVSDPVKHLFDRLDLKLPPQYLQLPVPIRRSA